MSQITSSSRTTVLIACAASTIWFAGNAIRAQLDSDYPGNRRYCSGTANAMFEACRNEGEPNYWKAVAICTNIEDEDDRGECFDEAIEERRENTRLCRSQLSARRQVCDDLDQDRYEPDFEPELFDNDFTRLSKPNRYYPLGIGYRWDFAAPDETTTIEILKKTKLIEGVTCVVVNDQVAMGGIVVEDTNDWIAQARDGDVYYCGEEVKDFESFEGDQPPDPELVSIEGSFKVGRDGDKPGILFRYAPKKGEVYRQEFSLGNAEDVALVLTTSYAYGREPELDRFVPRALVEMLCPGDCVVTKEYTPMEPGAFERKYYASGIGKFLEVNPDTGHVARLIGCNFDPRCNVLR